MENTEPEYLSIISLGYDIHVISKRFRAVHIKSSWMLSKLIPFGFILSLMILMIPTFIISTFWVSLVVMLFVLGVYTSVAVITSNRLAKERATLQKLPLDQQMLIDGKSFEIFNNEIIKVTFRKGWLSGEIHVKTEKCAKKFRVEKGLSQTIVTALKLVYGDSFTQHV
jgi:K+-sensing histidine kinase KdpD